MESVEVPPLPESTCAPVEAAEARPLDHPATYWRVLAVLSGGAVIWGAVGGLSVWLAGAPFLGILLLIFIALDIASHDYVGLVPAPGVWFALIFAGVPLAHLAVRSLLYDAQDMGLLLVCAALGAVAIAATGQDIDLDDGP